MATQTNFPAGLTLIGTSLWASLQELIRVVGAFGTALDLAREAAYLSEMTDGELERLGLRRDQIVDYIYGGKV